LNETDYIWSKFKHANISEFQIMRAHEVSQLQKLENIMLKKKDNMKNKEGQDDDTRDLLRYLPERQLRLAKINIHTLLFKELLVNLTKGGEGNVLYQI